MTCTEIHFSGVWFLMKIIVGHVESHMNLRGRAGAKKCCRGLECREPERYDIHNVWGFRLC